jgi:hypothetical protein
MCAKVAEGISGGWAVTDSSLVVPSRGEVALVGCHFPFPFLIYRRSGIGRDEDFPKVGEGIGAFKEASAGGRGCSVVCKIGREEVGEGSRETFHCGEGAYASPNVIPKAIACMVCACD